MAILIKRNGVLQRYGCIQNQSNELKNVFLLDSSQLEPGVRYIQFDDVLNVDDSVNGEFTFESNGETFSSMSIVVSASHSD